MIARLGSLWSDRSAAVAPIVAVLGASLVCTAGIALDVGAFYSGSKRLKAATEAAALYAAGNPANALSRAQDYLQRNGYPSSVIQSIQAGRYCPDKSLAPTGRFFASAAASPCPGNGQTNAVRLKTSQPSSQYMLALLGNASPIPNLAATATAAKIDEAGVQVSSGVLGLSNGVVNQLLTLLTGRNIALTGAQITTLMGSDIDMGLFMDKLAARAGRTGTYAELLSSPIAFSDVLGAAGDAAAVAGSTPTSTLLLNLSAQVGSAYKVKLTGLADLGVWEKMPVGNAQAQTSLRAGINAFQLLNYALLAGGQPPSLSLTPAVRLTGMATDILSNPRFGYGPANETSAYTAVTRLLLDVDVNLNVPILGPVLGLLGLQTLAKVPLLIEIGSGSASIANIQCTSEADQDSVVTVNSRASVLKAYIGVAHNDPLALPFKPLSQSDFDDATILGGVLSLKAAVEDPIAAAQPITFRRQSGTIGRPASATKPGIAGAPITVSSGSQLGPLLTTLGSKIEVKLLRSNLGLLLNPVLSVVGSTVGLVLTTVVDPLVTSLLATLGIQLGTATIWTTGVRCGVPVLV
ncbi:hypothetical protein HY78_06745 [Rhizorhabdus wittichii DC-6]|nr:hypothetical protein HY78_06745 [Rhizorhabdus wittichii DC-6]